MMPRNSKATFNGNSIPFFSTMQLLMPLWASIGLIVCLGLYILFQRRKTRIPKGLKLPPGPPGRFLIGNLLDFPTRKEWLTFDKWAKVYGDLVFVKVFGVTILLVNSYELARELFDRRGSIYSDKAHSVVINELVGLDWSVFMLSYNGTWKQLRTYFHQFLGQAAVKNYQEIQMKYTKFLLKLLHNSPEDFRSHFRFIAGATILEVTYGIRALSDQDPYIVLSEETIAELTRAGVPGTYFVDIFPPLKHIPIWFPGAKFRRELDQLKKKAQEMVDKPHEFVRTVLRNGRAIPCVSVSLIEHFENDPHRPADYEDIVKKVSSAVYMAGIDTTDGYLALFVRAMLLHPHVQKRAQAELDEVVGSGSLPCFNDFARLKYIRAIAHEVLRWNTVAPIALPHALSVDDVVNGYFIPKGTIVLGNSWTLLRSESVYGKDGDQFRPERFLDENTPLPEFAFGFGRRVCPGRHLGETTAFIISACILHLFHILPVHSEEGPELPGEEEYDSGAVLRPKAFKCRFIPRSSTAVHILDGLDI